MQWLMPVIPELWEAKAGRWLEVRISRPSWPTWWNPISTKIQKISQAWWCMPVVPATWEAEARKSLEPGRRKLQWAEIMPLHSSLGITVRLGLKKKKKNLGSSFSLLYPSWLMPGLLPHNCRMVRTPISTRPKNNCTQSKRNREEGQQQAPMAWADVFVEEVSHQVPTARKLEN